MSKWICCSVALFLASTSFSFALDDVITVLKISDSQRSLVINEGLNNKIENNSFAFLIELTDEKKLQPVAKVRSVHVGSEKSIWTVFSLYSGREIKERKLYLLWRADEFLNGRVDTDTYKREIVAKAGSFTRKLNRLKKGDLYYLAQKRDKFHKTKNLHVYETRTTKDVELMDLSVWDNHGWDENAKTPKVIFRSPHMKEFNSARLQQAFDKMALYTLKKINDPNYDLNGIDKKTHSGPVKIFRTDSTTMSVTDEMRNKNKKRTHRDKQYYNRLQKNGDSWSDDFSDTELAETITHVGILKEKKRREQIVVRKYRYFSHFNLGMNVLSQDKSDGQDVQGNKFHVEYAMEFFTFRTVPVLNHFSLNAGLRYAKDSFEMNEINVLMNELSGSVGLKWYPLTLPNVAEKNILYAGMNVRYGKVAIFSRAENENGIYTASVFPGLEGGLKYMFSSGWGVNLSVMLDFYSFDRLKRSEKFNFLLNRFDYTSTRLNMSIGHYF